MTTTDPFRLRNAARQVRAGVLRGAIDRTLLAHGIDIPGLAEVLRGIVIGPEAACADGLDRWAAEIENDNREETDDGGPSSGG